MQKFKKSLSEGLWQAIEKILVSLRMKIQLQNLYIFLFIRIFMYATYRYLYVKCCKFTASLTNRWHVSGTSVGKANVCVYCSSICH